MRWLVVYCHPVPESFCASLRDLCIDQLHAEGHDTRLVDLYAEGFQPVMDAEERRRYNVMTAGDHPLPEHAGHLRWAEAILFVYPTWWYGLPAMLKGWLDRTWTPGVTFDIPEGGGKIVPLMTHIRAIAVVTTCGAPMWWSYLVGHPGRKTILRGIRALCAPMCRTLFLAHYRMDASTPLSRHLFRQEVERRLTRFARAGAAKGRRMR